MLARQDNWKFDAHDKFSCTLSSIVIIDLLELVISKYAVIVNMIAVVTDDDDDDDVRIKD